MVKKDSPKPTKAWKPGDPLKIDWSTLKDAPESFSTNPLDTSGNPLFSKPGTGSQPRKSANHKSHIRQKKV